MGEDPLGLLLEYLDASLQPTFVLRLSNPDSGSKDYKEEVVLTHANPALQRLENIHTEVVRQIYRALDSFNFGTDLGVSLQKDSHRAPISFCGIDWAVTVVGKKWLIAVSTEEHNGWAENGRARLPQALSVPNIAATTEVPTSAARASTNSAPPLVKDTIQRPPLGAVNPQGHLGDLDFLKWMRQYDWASSPIGPIEEWSPELRHICEFALATTDPLNILWGDENTLLYNQAYSIVVGDKHPGAMGRPFKE